MCKDSWQYTCVWLDVIGKLVADILLGEKYINRYIWFILRRERQTVLVRSKPIAIVSVIKHDEYAQVINAVAVEHSCKNSLDERWIPRGIALPIEMARQTSTLVISDRHSGTRHLRRGRYSVSNRATKSKHTNVGLSCNRNWAGHDTRVLYWLSAQFRREGDEPVDGSEGGWGNSNGGMADDRRQQMGMRQNFQCCSPVQIHDG